MTQFLICFVNVFSWQETWDDVVVEGPCDSGWRDSTDSAGQQEALSLVEGHVSEQLGEDGVSVNREGHSVSVLAHCIRGYAGVTACVLGLEGDEFSLLRVQIKTRLRI